MNLEELTKSQIILLTLLVSFVTSIATGIVTVSLMEQAPPAIAQTVNRVVERTIERVVPAASQAAAVVTTEKTVVVKESDLIGQAIAATSPAIVRIVREDKNAEQETIETFLTLGVVLNESGLVLAESLRDTSGLIAVRSDGVRARLWFVSKDDGTGLSRLQAATSTDAAPLSWKPLALSSGQPALGESVVALTLRDSLRVAQGIVTEVPDGDGSFIDTDIPPGSILAGTPVIDLDGRLVGISTMASRAASENAFLPASRITRDSSAEPQN